MLYLWNFTVKLGTVNWFNFAVGFRLSWILFKTDTTVPVPWNCHWLIGSSWSKTINTNLFYVFLMASLILMKMWKLEVFGIWYSVAVFHSKSKRFCKELQSDYFGHCSGFCPMPGTGHGGAGGWLLTNHPVKVITALVNAPLCLYNFLGIGNKLKPNPLSKPSIVLGIQGTLIYCWLAASKRSS